MICVIAAMFFSHNYARVFYCMYISEIPGYILLLKNCIFIVHSEDTFLSFMCEDISVTMVITRSPLLWLPVADPDLELREGGRGVS